MTSWLPGSAPQRVRHGRPRPGGTLHRVRRVVVVVRVVAVLAALVVSTEMAPSSLFGSNSGLDPALLTSSALIAAIPLGGLLWWVEPEVPEYARTRERAIVTARRVRAELGTVAVLLVLVVPALSEQSWPVLIGLLLGTAAMLVHPVTLYFQPGRDELRAQREAIEGTAGGIREQAFASVGSGHAVLVRPVPFGPAGQAGVVGQAGSVGQAQSAGQAGAAGPRPAVTIRPRPPAEQRPPLGTGVWLAHGSLSCGGRELVVTDRRGRAHRIPLASSTPNGATGLIVLRHAVRSMTRYGWSAPNLRELLCVRDGAGRRLLDVELYGFTRTDLIEFATVTGLGLEHWQPAAEQYVVPGLTGNGPTPFDLAFPRAAGHRVLRGSAVWWTVVGAIVSLLVTLAVLLGIGSALAWLSGLVALGSPWQQIVFAVLGAVSFGAVVALAYAVGTRMYAARRRRPQPPDAI